MAVGAMPGAKTGAKDPDNAFEAGAIDGAEAVMACRPNIVGAAILIGAVGHNSDEKHFRIPICT